ncbi:unnamed protein product [Rotaria magnacalcarata]|uniref:Uncharacterized protein n=1 Tax=Rotaria magnacalcarata TaxID=392030 RepID=A0A816WZH4_9BILA|nr:unnamed protein product [Rotaria magnacalcarata]
MDMNWISFFGWILLPQIGGVLGGLVTAKQIKTWYKKLLKPAWCLPNAIFGPALVIILILFINIFICALQFWQINSYASMLLVPYLIWVGFASALTMSIWQLNSPYAQPSSRRQRSVSDPHQQ